MSKRDFLHCTIKEFQLRLKAWRNQKEDEINQKSKLIDYQSWVSGAYVQIAIASALSSKVSYPKNPFGSDDKKELLPEKIYDEKTEEELKQEERYFELLVKQANAKLDEIGNEEGRQDD